MRDVQLTWWSLWENIMYRIIWIIFSSQVALRENRKEIIGFTIKHRSSGALKIFEISLKKRARSIWICLRGKAKNPRVNRSSHVPWKLPYIGVYGIRILQRTQLGRDPVAQIGRFGRSNAKNPPAACSGSGLQSEDHVPGSQWYQGWLSPHPQHDPGVIRWGPRAKVTHNLAH